MSADYLKTARLRELNDQLSDRDRAVLHRVSELRFVSGAQLIRLYFADSPARTARAALLRLTRLGCLKRLPRVVGGVRAGSAGYVYRLGPAGQRLAAGYGWQPPWRKPQAHIPGTLFVSHALAVAELHTLLIEADQSGRVELLELSAEPACWRRYSGTGAQRGILKPDSYLRLGAGEYEDSYFVEVDMGSEGSWALERQLRAYMDYEASGAEQAERGVFPKTLWLAPDAERVRAIEACVERLPMSSRELFAVTQFDDVLAYLMTSNSRSNSHSGTGRP